MSWEIWEQRDRTLSSKCAVLVQSIVAHLFCSVKVAMIGDRPRRAKSSEVTLDRGDAMHRRNCKEAEPR